MRKILFVVNDDYYFISHRLVIAKKLVEEGWSVYVACKDSGVAHKIEDVGAKFISFPFSRSTVHPLQEIKLLYRFYRLYKNVQPEIIHHISLKPVIYGSLVARLLRMSKVVNAISGLGYIFTDNRRSLIKSVMIALMRVGFNNNLTVIFQNKDDRKAFSHYKITNKKNKTILIKGAGVDLIEYHYLKPQHKEKIVILFPARMLFDKGINELREASDMLKGRYINKVKFVLAGGIDKHNKASASSEFLHDWADGNYVEWIGYQSDMKPVFRNADIVVLPSYREGMPKSLIEACAIGRPIITTNAIGCKECVDENINGLKVPVRAALELAKAMETLINNREAQVTMGKHSRDKAEKEFDVNLVLEKHLEIYKNI